MELIEALKQLAELAKAKAEGRSVTLCGRGVQTGRNLDPSYYVTAHDIMYGNVVGHVDPKAREQAAWDQLEAKKHIGKAWRASAHTCMFMVGHYADGHVWSDQEWVEKDWTGHQYAEPKWGTDISEWEWKTCLKPVLGDTDFRRFAKVLDAILAGAKVRTREPEIHPEIEYHLGGSGGNVALLSANSLLHGVELISFSFPRYEFWRPEEAARHKGMAYRLAGKDAKSYDGIIGQHNSGGPWPSWEYGNKQWDMFLFAPPVWGTCPSGWDWKKCGHITKYVTEAVT